MGSYFQHVRLIRKWPYWDTNEIANTLRLCDVGHADCGVGDILQELSINGDACGPDAIYIIGETKGNRCRCTSRITP